MDNSLPSFPQLQPTRNLADKVLPASKIPPADISQYLPTLPQSVRDAAGQTADDYRAGNYVRAFGDAQRTGLTAVVNAAGVVPNAIKSTIAPGIQNMVQGFLGTPALAPAAKAAAPAMDAIETSDPRAPEAPPDSLGVRNFKTLARITSGMTRNQLAEYVRNYPRAPLIDPKTAAAGNLLESLKTTFEQKKNALTQIDTSTAAGKKAQADGYINAQLDFQKGLISMTQPTITPFVGGAGLTDPSNPSN